MLIFDVGGTFIKYAIINNSQIVYKSKVTTPNGEQIVACLYQVYLQINSQFEISEIGISTAGQVDTENGSIAYAGPTMPGYTGVQLKSQLETLTGLKVTVINDVEACIYNYSKLSDVVYISLGTGIGGACKINGQVLRGANGVAMEVGHLAHQQGDSFENVCSTKALLENYQNLTNEVISGEQLDKLVAANDQPALTVLDQFFKDLAAGLVNLKYILDFNYLIIGGGVTEAKFFTADRLYQALNQQSFNTNIDNLQIDISELGNDAALLGVYKYITEENNE